MSPKFKHHNLTFPTEIHLSPNSKLFLEHVISLINFHNFGKFVFQNFQWFHCFPGRLLWTHYSAIFTFSMALLLIQATETWRVGRRKKKTAWSQLLIMIFSICPQSEGRERWMLAPVWFLLFIHCKTRFSAVHIWYRFSPQINLSGNSLPAMSRGVSPR